MLRSVLVAALAGTALAQVSTTSAAAPESSSPLETADFDPASALLELGVDVSTVTALEGVVYESTKRSAERRNPINACALSCMALEQLYGSNHVFAENTTSYTSFIEGYWSLNQAEVHPYCVFKPSNAGDVSIAVLINRLTQCPFAAKSGGHSAYRGAANIPGGMTISLANLDTLQLSADQSSVAVGAGNLWSGVFNYLDPYNLTVVGGRLADIGVGGLTTGGGISYFSNLYGWACDNVVSYDVVLANGCVVTASPTSHPDLYKALRGGGNNFGLVVKFQLSTISLPNNGDIYIGARTYLESSFDAVDQAFYNLIVNSADDPKAGAYLVYVNTMGMNLGVPTFYYSDAPAGAAAPIWDEFEAIPNIGDTTGVHNIETWAADVAGDSPPGFREMYYTMTFKADLETFTFARTYFFDNVANVTGISGIVPNIVFQGITTPELVQFQRNGGNTLGLDVRDGPMFVMLIAAMWDNASDDEAVAAFMSNVLTATKAFAVARGVQKDFVYMNYASKYQDVLSSYGPATLAQLRAVSAKYDPHGVYQTLQPGYFKLGGQPPVTGSGYFNY